MFSRFTGKIRHFFGTPLCLKPRFLSGWLRRKYRQTLPCALPSCQYLLHIPRSEFYLSYFYFAETKPGREEIAHFVSRLNRNDSVIDVGAFCGVYSFAAKAATGGDAQVTAIEASAVNVDRLYRVSTANSILSVQIIHALLSESNLPAVEIGTQDLMVRLGDSNTAFDCQETSAPSATLDRLVAEHQISPTVIKVDVDGYEWKFLNGAKKTLIQFRPWIWLEVHPEYLARQGISVSQIHSFFSELDYKSIPYSDAKSSTASISHHIIFEPK